MREHEHLKNLYKFIGCVPEEKASCIAKRARDKSDDVEFKHNEALYKILGITLALRYRCDDQDEWRQVCRDSYWDHRRDRDRPKENASDSEKTSFVTNFLNAGNREVRKERAWKYGRVVHHFYRKKTKPWELKEEIEAANGIEKIIDKATREEPRRAKSEDIDSIADEADVESSNDENPEDPEHGESKDQDADLSAKAKTASQKKVLRIGVDVEPSEFDEAMSRTKRQRARIIVNIEESEGSSKWKTWKSESIKYL